MVPYVFITVPSLVHCLCHRSYLVVVKVGKPTERSKPGNRGKRDSDAPMSPLELEIYHQMRNIIGIDPAFYEYLFTVDADTVRILPCWLDISFTLLINVY